MGTNYYRILSSDEIKIRKNKLINDIHEMDVSPSSIEQNFTIRNENSWENKSPWDEFMDGMKIHLGKRSNGWKFCWNFHKNKHYTNKEELFSFIRSGRVVDEYGDEWDVEDFITMAVEWYPNGFIVDQNYRKNLRKMGHGTYWTNNEKYDDLIIDGLRVSSSDDFI